MTDDRPVPLDEYPVHQVPLSMKYVATGDRNAYDRCIFHVLDHEGRTLLILGLGVYPNLGVIDAYATLRLGDTLHAVRASDALDDDSRTNLAVGPLRIPVERPLCDFVLSYEAAPDDADGLSYEINWTADFPALWEPHHLQRRGGRLTLEGRRFVQAGHCDGWIRVGGRELRVQGWTGTRDRSWGVRPVPGEEGGRFAEEQPTAGFHWIWPGEGDALRRHVTAQPAYYDWVVDGLARSPLIEQAFDRLEELWPPEPGPPVLNWGDARIGNVIYDGFDPVAVLDWEMAALAPREVDLGWTVCLHRFFQDLTVSFGRRGLPDFLRRDRGPLRRTHRPHTARHGVLHAVRHAAARESHAAHRPPPGVLRRGGPPGGPGHTGPAPRQPASHGAGQLLGLSEAAQAA
jgi:hypothetical protein